MINGLAIPGPLANPSSQESEGLRVRPDMSDRGRVRSAVGLGARTLGRPVQVLRNHPCRARQAQRERLGSMPGRETMARVTVCRLALYLIGFAKAGLGFDAATPDEGIGGPSRARTWDHLIKSQLLYQLS